MTDTTTDTSGPEKIAELAKGITFAMLTTVDETGAFVSRPMAHQDSDFDGELWYLSSRDSRKVAHLTANPHVGVTLSSRDVWISINGTASVVDDRAKVAELWTTQMDGWFPQGPDDTSVVAIRVDGDTAEYWDTPGGLVASALSLVKVKTTGHRYAGNDNEVVDL
ncbi:pyridoxamine 5'-phosphate oxidase family protein [uncultured Friedmanniella sp.]|uniref:pyridoxamine 5'-phosphate oxidase family protein n=1 Tax=uncultured Friedmanniella sp. TaxID=335381 RepID=UPI0035CAD76A